MRWKHKRGFARYKWPATPLGGDSEEVGLLHNAKELFLVYLTVSVTIRLVDHFLRLLVGHALAELFCHTLQVLKGDLASLVVVEETESFQDLVLRITVQDLVRHHLQELFVADRAAAVVPM